MWWNIFKNHSMVAGLRRNFCKTNINGLTDRYGQMKRHTQDNNVVITQPKRNLRRN